jgi:hypothetical protein
MVRNVDRLTQRDSVEWGGVAEKIDGGYETSDVTTQNIENEWEPSWLYKLRIRLSNRSKDIVFHGHSPGWDLLLSDADRANGSAGYPLAVSVQNGDMACSRESP